MPRQFLKTRYVKIIMNLVLNTNMRNFHCPTLWLVELVGRHVALPNNNQGPFYYILHRKRIYNKKMHACVKLLAKGSSSDSPSQQWLSAYSSSTWENPITNRLSSVITIKKPNYGEIIAMERFCNRIWAIEVLDQLCICLLCFNSRKLCN